MKKLKLFLSFLLLAGLANAGIYDGVVIDTGTKTAERNLSGFMGIAASADTPTVYPIVIDGRDSTITVDGVELVAEIASKEILFDNIVRVKNEGATPLQDAIDAITDSSASNKYGLKLGSSNFTEASITLKNGIFLVGEFKGGTILTSDISYSNTAAEKVQIGLVNLIHGGNLSVTFGSTETKFVWLNDTISQGTTYTFDGTDKDLHFILSNQSSISANMVIDDFFGNFQHTTAYGGATISNDSYIQHYCAEITGTVTVNNTSEIHVRSAATTGGGSVSYVLNDTPKLNMDNESASTADITNNTGTDASVEILTGFSAGGISPDLIIVDNVDGTVDLPAVSVFLYQNDHQFGIPRRYNIAAIDDQSLTDNALNYIMVDYNAGSPQYLVSATDTSNASNIKLLATRYRRNSTELHGVDLKPEGEGLADKLNELEKSKNPVNRISGLVLGETGTRVATLTAGEINIGASIIDLSAFNSSVDTWDFYAHVASVYTLQGATTQYSSSQYDDGTQLQTLLPSKFVPNFVWRDIDNDSHAFYILGNQHNSVALALDEGVPTGLPDIILKNAKYVGRIIVGTGLSTASLITSAFAQPETTAGAISHDSLANVVGGTYHLLQADYNELTDVNAQLGALHTDGSPIFASATIDTIYGSSASGGDLLLQSTSHATKGSIKFGANSVYDQVNDRWGFGTLTPNSLVEMVSALPIMRILSNGSSPNRDAMLLFGIDSNPQWAIGFDDTADTFVVSVGSGFANTKLTIEQGGNTGLGGETNPQNILDINGAAVIGASYSGVETAPANGLLVEGQFAQGLNPTANMEGIATEAGLLTLKERATPTADTNYGKIYTKTDNKLYFQSGDGTEHEIALVP